MAIALLAWSGTALAEDLVVIESSDLKVLAEGTMIGDGKALELPAGVKIVLMGGSGKTVRLAGPYKGTPSAGTGAGDGRLVTALVSLVQRREDDTSRIGAIRAIDWRKEAVKSEADVLVVDVGERGTQCITGTDAKTVSFVLDPEKKKGSEKVVLMSAETGAMETLTWPAGKGIPTLAWPNEVPLDDGNTYLVELPPQSSLTQFTLKVIPPKAGNGVQRLAQLSEAGCNAQARLMLEVLKKSAQ
jgi:hypothetical protein